MPNDAPVVLLTRPSVQSTEFRQKLGAEADVVISPIIEIRPVNFSIKKGAYHTFVFASQNAVQAGARSMDLRGLRGVTVGDRSAKVARDLGMDVVSAGGNAQDLIATVISLKPEGKTLFIRGEHTRGDVAEQLNLAGIETDFVIAYGQDEQQLSSEARELLRGDRPVIIPLFSPRSARLLSQQIAKVAKLPPIALIGMSDSVIRAWEAQVPDAIFVAERATGPAMAKETRRRIADWS